MELSQARLNILINSEENKVNHPGIYSEKTGGRLLCARFLGPFPEGQGLTGRICRTPSGLIQNGSLVCVWRKNRNTMQIAITWPA